MTPNLLTDAGQRAIFGGSCAALIRRLQLLEIKIGIALMSNPTREQFTKLVEADEQLGVAARALQRAGQLIGELKP